MAQDDLNTSFPVNEQLTAIAVAYRNPDVSLIADSVLPRVARPGTVFKYTKYDDVTRAYRVPSTAVGPKGKVNRVDLDGQEGSATTNDNAIEVPLSHYDLQPGSRVNAEQHATEYATSVILLQREIDVSNLVFNASSYPDSQKVELVGDEQIDHASYEGNPLELIQQGLDAMLVRGNRLVFGQRAWAKFRMLPEVVKAVHGNDGGSGMATREAVARLFEVQEVLVGSSFVNIKKPGEAPEMVRVWDRSIAAHYIDRAAAQVGGLTFGCTFEYGSRVAGSMPNTDVGMRGGKVVRVGESTKPLVVAPYAGYFWENAVSEA